MPRFAIAAVLATALALCHVAVAQAPRAARLAFDIPQQPLSDALTAFGRQAGLRVLRRESEAGTQEAPAPAVRGELSVEEALQKLLARSGLRYEFVDERTVRISQVPIAQQEGEGGTRVAQAEEGAQKGVAGKDSEEGAKLEEVVVTAQKKKERLQDVPVPVSTLRAESLVQSNQLHLQDYYNKIPGMSLAEVGDTGQPLIAIRGLVTGGQSNSTVALFIDDVPYGATVNPGVLPSAPDVDPGTLDHIEILRGPQGTLYGASGIGGLVKYVTIDPSTSGASGQLFAGTMMVNHGSGLGHDLRATVNVPLSDTVAVRASGFTRLDPGFVDDPQTGRHDINDAKANGGRIAALWRPSDSFSLKLSALKQDSRREGTADVDQLLGGFSQNAMPGTGLYTRKTEAYSATAAAKLSHVDLISITGYNVDTTAVTTDWTPSPFWSGLAAAAPPFGFGVAGASSPIDYDVKKFTQEVRATIPIGKRLSWLVGAFYTHEDFFVDYNLVANDPTTGAYVGTLLKITEPATYAERALFTTVTLDLTDRLDLQVGGRYGENKQNFSSIRVGADAGLFYGSDPSIIPDTHSKDSAFTYLVTPRYKISPDLMVYARLASGYRPGGPNANCSSTVPCEYKPDTTENYDLGLKGTFLDRRLSIDAAVYYIDWKDIQIPLRTQTAAWTDNVGRAKSQGVEFSTEYRPLSGLTIAGWVAWNDATLTENFPSSSPNVGRPGDRLPYSSRFSGSLSADEQFPLWGTLTAVLGGSLSYVGDRYGTFKNTATRAIFPAYTQVDVHLGLEHDTWTVNGYVNNLTDRRGVLRSGLDSLISPSVFTYIQPRTVGVSVSKTFK